MSKVIAVLCYITACVNLAVTQLSTVTPKPLPTLPNDPLQINVEATIYRKNQTSGVERKYTEYVQEYRDPDNNQGLSIMTNGSMETRSYYDLAGKQGMALTRDTSTTPLNQAECTVHNLTQPSNRFGEFSVETRGGQLVISNISSFFAWGADKNPVYSGSDTIRGIPADKWLITYNYSVGADLTYITFIYYFSSGHEMPYYGRKPIPLRIVMDGSHTDAGGRAEYNHVYDFGLVAPFNDIGDNFFSTPRGVYCKGRNSPPDQTPNFADQYAVSEEVIDRGTTVITNSKIYFDYKLQLTRTDLQYESDVKYNYSNIRVVHDFNLNYEMVIVKENGTCQVTPIPTSDGVSSWDVNVVGGKPTLYHTKDLPWTQNLQFQGYRVEKGIPVTVWSSQSQPASNKVTVQELWYAATNWTVRSSQAAVSSFHVTVGFYYLSYDKKTHAVIQQIESNTYNQYYGPLQAYGNIVEDVFDVSECYNKDSVALSHLNIEVLDSEGLFLQGQVTSAAIAQAVRGSLSEISKVSATRFTNFEVYDERADTGSSPSRVIRVYFVLREKLLLDSAALSDITQDEIDNAKLVTLLETEIADQKGLIIPVTALDGHVARYTVISLLSNDEGSVSEELGGTSDGVKTYTPAAMAGLGVGMLLLGAVLTIAVGGVLWIKRFDINLPYVSQNNE